MEASMTHDVEYYDATRTVLATLPTDEEWNKAFSDAEQSRKKISGKVGELIKELDSRRSSVVAHRKDQQAQLLSLRTNISTLQKRAARRRAELMQLTEDLAEGAEELDLTKAHISLTQAMLDDYENRADALNVGISNMKNEQEELTTRLKKMPSVQ